VSFLEVSSDRGSPASGATPSEPLKPLALGRVASTGAAGPRCRIGRAPHAVAALGLRGRSDAKVGLWSRLVIAPLVLDQPIVLGCRVLEHPEGVAGRADP
jgi:hypothetical protein